MVQLRGGSRVGPLETFNWGKYNRVSVKDVIRKDPQYFMVAVKDWLDVSPDQATLFTLLYEGEIPQRYIKEFSPDLSPALGEKLSRRESNVSLGKRVPDPDRIEQYLYESNKDILPNWDFDPESKPEWVKNYEKALQNLKEKEGLDYIPISRRLSLYNTYQQEFYKENLKG